MQSFRAQHGFYSSQKYAVCLYFSSFMEEHCIAIGVCVYWSVHLRKQFKTECKVN